MLAPFNVSTYLLGEEEKLTCMYTYIFDFKFSDLIIGKGEDRRESDGKVVDRNAVMQFVRPVLQTLLLCGLKCG